MYRGINRGMDRGMDKKWLDRDIDRGMIVGTEVFRTVTAEAVCRI
jgi:hypothetical protein